MAVTRALAGVFAASEYLRGLSGWRRLAVACALGVLSATAFAPLYAVPLLLPAFSGLLWLLQGAQKPKQAAFVGWAFGVGHFAVGLYWVGEAFLVHSARHAWIMPFAVVALAAGMALFHGLVGYLLARSRQKGVGRLFAFALIWLLVEWLRSWIFTGFPWNLLGSVWGFSPAMLQLASITGVWGLSVVTLLAAAAPALLFEGLSADYTALRKRVTVVFACLLLPGLVWLGGGVRLMVAPEGSDAVVEDVRLRLVQPNIPQRDKWKPELRGEHIVTQMNLSAAKGFDKITHVIWAETAVPFLLSSDKDLRTVISRVVPPSGYLLTGAPRVVEMPQGEGGRVERQFRNSIHILDRRGEIAESYDKFHLVPFGEYVPLKGLLRFAKLTAGQGDFSPGPGPRSIALPGLPPVSPLICYEIIFPGAVVDADNRPDWIFNATNDGWFGQSSGPYQHLVAAQLRAVEEGLPVIRVANTGVSAAIDPYGRIVESLPLGTAGAIDANLPRKIPGGTVFSWIGNFSVAILAFLLLLPLVIRYKKS